MFSSESRAIENNKSPFTVLKIAMGVRSYDINTVPTDLEFSVFTKDEIKRLSVVKIVSGLSFDAFGHSLPGGLHDAKMGAHGKQMRPCATCRHMQACPGHLGHIELNALVYNPFFSKLVQRMCNIFCMHCYKIQIPGNCFIHQCTTKIQCIF